MSVYEMNMPLTSQPYWCSNLLCSFPYVEKAVVANSDYLNLKVTCFSTKSGARLLW